ncbi:hypothetical protein C8R44DRAFT_984911 [Mycena epipterygia]|nr:hypothetical protein C8R44DRAFT_984911 [Mycena epipterygia]
MPTVQQHGESTLAVARAQISDLDVKIAALELVLGAFRDERNILQEQLDAYIYPVDNLPNEIISEIFVNFIPPYPRPPPLRGIFSPVVLGQICRSWREIAFSTPSLWRAIQIDFEETETLDVQAALLETWLFRSGDCPLSISLQCDHHFEGTTTATRFLRAILPYCARWDDMTLVLPEADLRLIEGPMPLLRNLKFGPTTYPAWSEFEEGTSVPFTVFSDAPNLRAVELGHFFAPWVTTLPWQQLTALTATALYEYECISILQQSPALVHFLVSAEFSDSPPAQAALAKAEHVPPLLHLESLILTGLSSTHKNILQKLTLPALRTLEISERWLGANPCAIILSFIAKSGCTLDELRITDAQMSAHAYRQAFHSIPKISLKDY